MLFILLLLYLVLFLFAIKFFFNYILINIKKNQSLQATATKFLTRNYNNWYNKS
jgi:hypothetical protein